MVPPGSHFAAQDCCLDQQSNDPRVQKEFLPTARISSLRRRRSRWLFALFAFLGDLALWNCLYFEISWISGSYNLITYQAVLIPIIILMAAISLVGAYRVRTDFASLRYASEHLIACFTAYPPAAFLLYVVASFGASAATSRAIFSVALLTFAFISLLYRRVFWFFTSRSRTTGKFLTIADQDLGPVFYRDYLRSEQSQGVYYFAAHSSLLGKPIDGPESPTLRFQSSHILSVLNRVPTEKYEGIIIASKYTDIDSSLIAQLGVVHFNEMPVYSMESFYKTFWSRLPLSAIGPGWPFEANFLLVQNSAYSAIKRFVDFILALTALILLFPILLIVAVGVWVSSGAPVIYSQPRMGINNMPFTLYKFRSMRSGSDKGDCYTREGDSRITPFGAFLRKTRMDELPQLWNVLKGDMSIIGPRAEWTRLVEEYEEQIPNYHFRHLVRPGITGWAQVNYPYGASLDDTLQKLSYDLYYIQNFSLRLDAEVILKTLHVMSFGKGR